MDAKEVGRAFVAKTCEYLISLPFDVKFLQEAASAPDLEKGAQELAAGVVISTLSHGQEGKDFERFLDSVYLVRIGFSLVLSRGGEGAGPFRERFPDVYGALDADLACFQGALGPELWQWLGERVDGCTQRSFKGKRAGQYLEDDDGLNALYEDCLEFQTQYSVTEPQVLNRLRRPEQITEILQRRRRRGQEAEGHKRGP